MIASEQTPLLLSEPRNIHNNSDGIIEDDSQTICAFQEPLFSLDSASTGAVEVTSENTNAKEPFKGMMLMALSAFTFSIMSALVKYAGKEFHFTSSQLVFYRSLIQTLLGALACRIIGVSPFGPSSPFNLRLLLVARGTFGASALGLYFFTLLNMPLGDGTAIFFSGPALTSIAAAVFLKERFLAIDGICTFACLIGVALVAKPTFFGFAPSEKDGQDFPLPLWIPSAAAFLGACISAAAYVTVRMIAKNAHFYVNVFYFGFMSTILSSFIILFFAADSPLFTHDWTLASFFIQIAIGVAAFAAQSFLNKGLQLVPAGPGTLMRNLDIVFAFFFGILIFQEKINALSIIGSSIIGGATALAALVKFYYPVKQ